MAARGACPVGDRSEQLLGFDRRTDHTWGSREWCEAAESWAHLQLDQLGLHPVGTMTTISDQRWSWVWRIPTNQGDVLLKQTTVARAAEGSIHAFCADAAPAYVDQPLVYDRATARILFTDGGLTMAGSDWLAMPLPTKSPRW